MSNIFDLDKIKKQKQREEDNFTYAQYVADLEVVCAGFHLLPIEHQHEVFQNTAHLLIAIIKTAIKENKIE